MVFFCWAAAEEAGRKAQKVTPEEGRESGLAGRGLPESPTGCIWPSQGFPFPCTALQGLGMGEIWWFAFPRSSSSFPCKKRLRSTSGPATRHSKVAEWQPPPATSEGSALRSRLMAASMAVTEPSNGSCEQPLQDGSALPTLPSYPSSIPSSHQVY